MTAFKEIINYYCNPGNARRFMSLLLALLFLALFVRAIVRGKFSYGKADYDYHEHPVQFVIAVVFILGVSALCFYRFLVEMELLR